MSYINFKQNNVRFLPSSQWVYWENHDKSKPKIVIYFDDDPKIPALSFDGFDFRFA